MYDPWFRFRVQTTGFAAFAAAAALALVLMWRGNPWSTGTLVATIAAFVGLLLTLLAHSTRKEPDGHAEYAFVVLLCAGLAYVAVTPRFFADLAAAAWPLVFAGFALGALATPIAEFWYTANEAVRRRQFGAENTRGVDRREVANAFGVKDRRVRFARFDGGNDALECPLVVLDPPVDAPESVRLRAQRKKRWAFASFDEGSLADPRPIEEMACVGLQESDRFEVGFLWDSMPLGAALVLAGREEGELIAMSDEGRPGGRTVVVFRATGHLLADGQRWLDRPMKSVRGVPSSIWGILGFCAAGPCAAATLALLTIAWWA